MKILRYLTILTLVRLVTPEVSLAQNNFTAPPLSITWVRTNPPVNGLCKFDALNQFNFTTGQYWGCLPLDNPSANGFNVGGWKPISAPEVVGYGAALPTFCTIGRVFYLTSAMAGANVYGCTALNTWTLETGGAGGGSVTSVAAGCGLTGGPVTTSGTLSETIPVAAHNGSYAILTTDCGKALTSNVAGTYTLPQAGSTGFAAGWHGYVENVGGSGNVTVTTTTSTFYGNGGSGSSGVLVPGSGVELVSDGTNWLVLAYTAGPSGGGSGCTAAGPLGTVQASDGAGGCVAAFVGLSVRTGVLTGNNALGASALTSNTFGIDNNAFGLDALTANTTGNSNNALGAFALESNTSGSHNNAIGNGALDANTFGHDNNAIGQAALNSNISGDNNNAIGNIALENNTTGSDNNAIGDGALAQNTTGTSNVAIGNGPMGSNTTGSNNIAIGNGPLTSLVAGSNNIAIGQAAGAASTGSGGVFLGNNAGEAETGSNKLYIDNTNTAAPLIQGDFSVRTVFFNARAGATPHTPASSSEACTAGQTATDASFIYVCTAANTWMRAALSSF